MDIAEEMKLKQMASILDDKCRQNMNDNFSTLGKKQEMKPFDINIKNPSGDNDINRIFGYQEAINAFYRYIAEQTEFNPEKRYIDAVLLLDKISATNAKLGQLLKEAEVELKQDISELELKLKA